MPPSHRSRCFVGAFPCGAVWWLRILAAGLGPVGVTGSSHKVAGEHLQGPGVFLAEPPAQQQGHRAGTRHTAIPSSSGKRLTLGLLGCGVLTGPSWVSAGKRGLSVVFGSLRCFVSAWGKRPACWQGCLSSAVPPSASGKQRATPRAAPSHVTCVLQHLQLVALGCVGLESSPSSASLLPLPSKDWILCRNF